MTDYDDEDVNVDVILRFTFTGRYVSTRDLSSFATGIGILVGINVLDAEGLIFEPEPKGEATSWADYEDSLGGAVRRTYDAYTDNIEVVRIHHESPMIIEITVSGIFLATAVIRLGRQAIKLRTEAAEGSRDVLLSKIDKKIYREIDHELDRIIAERTTELGLDNAARIHTAEVLHDELGSAARMLQKLDAVEQIEGSSRSRV